MYFRFWYNDRLEGKDTLHLEAVHLGAQVLRPIPPTTAPLPQMNLFPSLQQGDNKGGKY